MDKPCEVCGGIGSAELIATCFQCNKAREHIYCMKILLMFVPEIWVCETCRYGGTTAKKSVRKELSHKAAGSNTFEMVRSEMSPSMRSRRLTEETGSSGRLRKQMSPGTGRVKFIPIEAIRMSSSGAQRVEISSPRKLHSSSGRVDARETMSRRTTIEFKSAPKKSSSEKGKETYKSVPAGHVKLFGHGSEGISSTTQAQESKSCTELKYKAIPIEYKNQVRSKKESLDTPCINDPGGNLRADARPKNSDFQGCDPLNILPKPEINLPTHPVLDATWCGSLEILDTVACGQFYDGFRAHIPEKVHPKALECSRLMPNVLRCTLLPCCDCWAEIFQNYSPTVNDMALFFSPGDFERSKQQYFSLLELLETRDMALRTDINGVSLLIFSSKRLDTDSYGSDVESFLWGAYYPAKGRLAAPPLLNYDSQANAANVEQ
ncbi:hypothetical protein TB2_039150 [Malus domestica]|uniref:uncharacterized protein LOC126625390 isoform X1 n=2 Tax=Malus sylvestris TaxID=3752 RepID=UPI0021AC357C|nr:uncharacterized protein LOC126625390 isoform X1 [Malus sylvestris]